MLSLVWAVRSYMAMRLVRLGLRYWLGLIMILGAIFGRARGQLRGVEEARNSSSRALKGTSGSTCPKRLLKFIHITKTGGTTIENLGNALDIKWGRFHTQSEKNYGFWHSFLHTKPLNIVRKYDWFMFVRNPFDRIVSEFWCKWGGAGRPQNPTSVSFNAWIRKQILNPNRGLIGHWEPMALYLGAMSMSPDITIHVGKFERFESDLHKILGDYNIDFPAHLSKMNNHFHQFNVSHLESSTIELIQRVYAMDFQIFGYDVKASEARLR